jgi:hypothetical protein
MRFHESGLVEPACARVITLFFMFKLKAAETSS